MYLTRGSALVSCFLLRQVVLASTPVIVKTVTNLGPQLTPDVTDVSRDGGYSALINGKIVWLYDDTECMDMTGTQLSFVSNTAAYQSFDNGNNVSTITDFGVVDLGSNQDGNPKTAILANTTVRTGGWIPFVQDELEFNKENNGKQRVAICEFHDPCAMNSQLLTLKVLWNRARNLTYIDQYHPSIPVRAASLCG